MKGKSLVAAAVIVPLAALFILLYIAANHGKTTLDRFGFFRIQENSLTVRAGQQLIRFDSTGQEREALDLARLHVRAVGDHDFFANGDLLVYHRTRSTNLLDHINQRLLPSATTIASAVKDDGFYRCDLQRLDCSRFAPDLPPVEGAFRLAIDANRDRVYLADTRAFKLYALSGAGEMLAVSDADTFHYPNQLVLVGDQLWVADTNNHRLVQVATEAANFAQVRQEIHLEQENTHRWPHQMTHDGSHWWVNMGDGRLADGRIQQVDNQGSVTAEIMPVQVQDPFALVSWQGALWLNDWESLALERFGAEGEALAPVESPALAKLVRQYQTSQQAYAALGYGGLGGFVLVMLGGLGAAWVLERKETQAAFTAITASGLGDAVNQPAKAAPTGEVFWLTNTLAARRRLLVGLGLLGLFLLAVSIGLLLGTGEKAPSPRLVQLLLGTTAFFLAVMGFVAWMFIHCSRCRVGVIGSSVVLEHPSGRRTIARDGALRYTKIHLLADDIAVFIGNPHQRFFDRQQLNDYLFPRLKNARLYSQWEMQKHLWRIRDPQIVGSLAVVTLAIGLYLWVRFAAL